MKKIPLIDLNAEPNSFKKEAETLNLNYCFQHVFNLEEIKDERSVVITDRGLNYYNLLKDKNVYLWLMEPPCILPQIYEIAKINYAGFKKIFSHNKNFCESVSNAFWYPWGSYFIPLEQHFIYPKSRNVSIVASSKMNSIGHIMRHQIIEKYKSLIEGIKQGDPVEPKIKWHKDYRFTIAIENSFVRGYFTEKIIDCFRTGVIPIYKGDPEILNYFNPEGVIIFDTIEELENILIKCDKKLYESKKKAIIENFHIASNFLYPWKYIKENYLNEIF